MYVCMYVARGDRAQRKERKKGRSGIDLGIVGTLSRTSVLNADG